VLQGNNPGDASFPIELAQAGITAFAAQDGGELTVDEATAVSMVQAGIQFADGFPTDSGVEETIGTLQVDGSTLADGALSLANLSALGVDQVRSDSDKLYVAVGSLEAVQSGLPAFDQGANVTLGLTGAQMNELVGGLTTFSQISSGAVFGAASVLTQAGIDKLALSDTDTSGLVALSDNLAADLAATGLTFGDSFQTEEGGAGRVDTTVVVTQGTNLGNGEPSASQLQQLGVDGVLIGADSTGNPLGISSFNSLGAAISGIAHRFGDSPGAATEGSLDVGVAVSGLDGQAIDAAIAGTTLSDTAVDLQSLVTLGVDKLVIGLGSDGFDAIELDQDDNGLLGDQGGQLI
jgi:hypothetical protein